MFVCSNISELRVYGCCHPCLYYSLLASDHGELLYLQLCKINYAEKIEHQTKGNFVQNLLRTFCIKDSNL